MSLCMVPIWSWIQALNTILSPNDGCSKSVCRESIGGNVWAGKRLWVLRSWFFVKVVEVGVARCTREASYSTSPAETRFLFVKLNPLVKAIRTGPHHEIPPFSLGLEPSPQDVPAQKVPGCFIMRPPLPGKLAWTGMGFEGFWVSFGVARGFQHALEPWVEGSALWCFFGAKALLHLIYFLAERASLAPKALFPLPPLLDLHL